MSIGIWQYSFMMTQIDAIGREQRINALKQVNINSLRRAQFGKRI